MSYIGADPSRQITTPAVDYFNGNGVTTTFQLTRAVTSVNAIQVVVNNVPQNAREAYGITASNQIVFTSAPSAGTNNIYVVYDSQVGQFVTPSPGTVGTIALANITNIRSGTSNLTVQTGDTNITRLTVNQTGAVVVASGLGLNGVTPTYTLDVGGQGATGAYSRLGGMAILTADTGFEWWQGTFTTAAGPWELIRRNNSDGSWIRAVGVDTAGRMIKPLQPAFMAVNPTGITGNGNTNIVTTWSTSPTYCFSSGNFNTANGRFTAPIAGRYFFSAQLMPTGDANVKFMVPFVNGSRAPTLVLPYLQGGSTRSTIEFSIILNLSAGDFVEVGASAVTGSSFDNSGYFCGYLMG
jgi:hypothetical protein